MRVPSSYPYGRTGQPSTAPDDRFKEFRASADAEKVIAALHSAQSGMGAATKLMDATANNVANVNTTDYRQTPRPDGTAAVVAGAGNNVDIAEQMVNAIVAQAALKANVSTVHTATAMYDEILRMR